MGSLEDRCNVAGGGATKTCVIGGGGYGTCLGGGV